nr:RNA-directed DNA polymerase, eukaryota [Tanacetum cinerariifolium]
MTALEPYGLNNLFRRTGVEGRENQVTHLIFVTNFPTVSNEACPYKIDKHMEDKPVMVIDDDYLSDKKYYLILVAKVKSFDSMPNLDVAFKDEGFENINIRYLRGWILDFMEEENDINSDSGDDESEKWVPHTDIFLGVKDKGSIDSDGKRGMDNKKGDSREEKLDDPFGIYNLLNQKDKNIEAKIVMSDDFSKPLGFSNFIVEDNVASGKAEGHVWKGETIVMGDFNEVCVPSERHGLVFNKQGALMFNSFINSSSLIDVPLSDFSFTWAVKNATKMSKLDRFLVSEGLLCQFPAMTGLILTRLLSNHRLIILRECDIDYGPIPFKMFHSSFDIEGLSSWEKDLVQKAKVKWAIEGDENLKYFHGIINKKRHQMAIRGISVNEEWVMDHPKDFRPISLIRCQYKIMGKILANRLSSVIGSLVSKEQSAIIRGRQTLDGLLILSDVIDWCNHKKRRTWSLKSILKKLMTQYTMPISFVRVMDGGCFEGVKPGMRKVSWFSWDSVVASKEVRGLGMSSFFAMNCDLPFKWIWRFKVQPEAMWVSVIKAIHGRLGNLDRCVTVEENKEVSICDKFTMVSFMGLEVHQEGAEGVQRFIDEGLCDIDGMPTRWLKLMTIKVNVLAWRLALNELPTRFNMLVRGFRNSVYGLPSSRVVGDSKYWYLILSRLGYMVRRFEVKEGGERLLGRFEVKEGGERLLGRYDVCIMVDHLELS